MRKYRIVLENGYTKTVDNVRRHVTGNGKLYLWGPFQGNGREELLDTIPFEEIKDWSYTGNDNNES